MARHAVVWVFALAVSTALDRGTAADANSVLVATRQVSASEPSSARSAPEGSAAGQAATSVGAFDVASVRRHPDDVRSSGVITVQPGGRFQAPAATVRELVAAAYGVLEPQIIGGPDWLDRDRFEIVATTSAEGTQTAVRGMLRTLLADRFGFAAHVETRELPVYALVISRDDGSPGPQLRASGPECAPMNGPPRGPATLAFVPAPPPPPEAGGPIVLGAVPLTCPSMMARMNGNGHWSIREMTLARFAQRLTIELDRPVIDRTGLAGDYDLDLTFASDAVVLAAPLGDVPSLRTALRDQLGLNLDSTRAPVEVLVIDRADAPTAN